MSTLTHGQFGTRAYHSWEGMKQRCFNAKTSNFHRYGGRGITVCDRWLNFNNFFLDMGECPEGYSIERLDYNGNYEPSNCKWIPLSEQGINRHTTTITPVLAVQAAVLCLTGMAAFEVAECLGIDKQIPSDIMSGRSWKPQLEKAKIIVDPQWSEQWYRDWALTKKEFNIIVSGREDSELIKIAKQILAHAGQNDCLAQVRLLCPDGYAVVPVEMTEPMISAWKSGFCDQLARRTRSKHNRIFEQSAETSGWRKVMALIASAAEGK